MSPVWRAAAIGCAAAIALVCATGLGVQTKRVHELDRQLRDARASNRGAGDDDVILARAAACIDTSGELTTATVRVAATAKAGRVVVLDDVPEPPRGKSWQVWGITADGAKRSMGVVSRAAPVMLIKVDDASVTSVAITLEQLGGAAQPTTTPLAFGTAAV